MRTIRSVHNNKSGNCCTQCDISTEWYALVEINGDVGHFNLPCGHSWSSRPSLTRDELALALLMMEGA